MRRIIVFLLFVLAGLALSGCNAPFMSFDRYGPSDEAYKAGETTKAKAAKDVANIQADAEKAVAAANENIAASQVETAKAEAEGLEAWAKFEFKKFQSEQWTLRWGIIASQFRWYFFFVTIWGILIYGAWQFNKVLNHALWERRIKVIQLSTGEVPPWAFLLEPRILDAILKRAKEVGGVISWSPKRINIVIVETGELLASYTFK